MSFYEEATETDLQILEEQLGRLPRGVIGIGARCICTKPLVVVTAPRLENGEPFPTTYYLTHPAVVHGCSVLEAEGLMNDYTRDISEDPELAARYQHAHEAYIADREKIGSVPELAGISAGGMPTRVKCLHAVVGHALAAGPGVNPMGDRALDVMAQRGLWEASTCHCQTN